MSTMYAEPRTPINDRHPVLLLGLDFGSTTSSALLAQAQLSRFSASGNMALQQPVIRYRGGPVFTPFHQGCIDETAIRQLLQQWLNEAEITPTDLFAGGVIITGLAAQQKNAHALAELVGELLGELLVSRADEGALESWLAFMGNCSALCREHPEQPILNLDIGGGTTNSALGIGGNVLATGCHFIGARHIQFIPGGYQLRALSEHGLALLRQLGINKTLGETLIPEERERIIHFYLTALEALVENRQDFFKQSAAQGLEQIPLVMPESSRIPAVTFSGGVGELLYHHLNGGSLPSTTYYGDLGIDLALAIANSPRLNTNTRQLLPENGGRATLYGLALHSTEISGSTLYLPQPQYLPLKNIPIVAQLELHATPLQLSHALELVRLSQQGACLQFIDDGTPISLEQLRRLGNALADAIEAAQLSHQHPLILLLESNLGKALGHYASRWGQTPGHLLVIDEIKQRQALFINVGKARQNIVPIAFYGIN